MCSVSIRPANALRAEPGQFANALRASCAQANCKECAALKQDDRRRLMRQKHARYVYMDNDRPADGLFCLAQPGI